MKRYGVPIIIAVIGGLVAFAHLVVALAGHPRPELGLLATALLLAAACVWLGIEFLAPKEK